MLFLTKICIVYSGFFNKTTTCWITKRNRKLFFINLFPEYSHILIQFQYNLFSPIIMFLHCISSIFEIFFQFFYYSKWIYSVIWSLLCGMRIVIYICVRIPNEIKKKLLVPIKCVFLIHVVKMLYKLLQVGIIERKWTLKVSQLVNGLHIWTIL